MPLLSIFYALQMPQKVRVASSSENSSLVAVIVIASIVLVLIIITVTVFVWCTNRVVERDALFAKEVKAAIQSRSVPNPTNVPAEKNRSVSFQQGGNVERNVVLESPRFDGRAREDWVEKKFADRMVRGFSRSNMQ